MALIVEDGTGIANAESYLPVADIETYAVARGLVFSATASVPLAEAAARRAATWLDAAYRDRLPGSRVKGRAQGLEWPRKDALDGYGEALPDDEIPREWLAAFCEAAVRELSKPGVLSPDVVKGRIKKSVSVSGAVSVTYVDDGDIVGSQRPILTLVDDILSGLLGKPVGSGRSSVKFLMRA